MGGEAMTRGVRTRGLGDAGLAHGGLHRALDGLLVQVVQAVLGLHRLREQRVKVRSQLVNQLHGLMGEFGIALPKGWSQMLKQAGELLGDSEECPVPGLLRTALLDQIQQIRVLSEQIKSLERQLGAWQRRAEECQRIAAIPGVGLLTATAAVATMRDARAFRSGREFAAFLGRAPC
jgi:transposase